MKVKNWFAANWQYSLVAVLAAVYSVLFPADIATLTAFGAVGAVVAVKSTTIANADAIPSVINQAFLAGARVRHHRGVVLATNGDSIASVFRVARIKSNDLVVQCLLDNASWGASCTADLGLYRTNGGAVVDADFFASAIDMNTARSGLDVTRESGVITVANMEKRVWELLGLAADPQIEYDVALTLVAAAAANGAACVQVEVANVG